MSRNYDNWGRLVAAVIKREEIWELCHARYSFTSSISSDSSSQDFESAVQELSPAPHIKVEWIEQPEPGVFITLGYSKDDRTEIRRIRFGERAAETWWSNNRYNVYQRFVGQPRIESGPFSDTSDHVELVMLDTPTSSTFSTNMKPTDSLVETVIEWGNYYEPDVYVTLRAYRANRVVTRDVTRVRFRGGKFEARQAEAWWLVNREKVCEKYGARAGLARPNQAVISFWSGSQLV